MVPVWGLAGRMEPIGVVDHGCELRLGFCTGTLVAPVQDEKPTDKPRMMNVSWTGSAQVNSKLKENQVRVTGEVNHAYLLRVPGINK